jgi:hypothetical protein
VSVLKLLNVTNFENLPEDTFNMLGVLTSKNKWDEK